MKFILTALLAAILLVTNAQQTTEDVVYLKNGSVLRGKIQPPPTPLNGEPESAGKVKIELLGGSVFVFGQAEIDSIKRENVNKVKLKEINQNYYRKNRGYRNITEFGFIYGTNLKQATADPYYYYGNTGDDVGISLHSINGYQVWPYLFFGAGVGIDRFITYRQTFSPFYVRIASEFLKRKVTPYVFFDAGYNVMWKKKNDDYYSYKNKGGYYISCGGGVRIYTRSRASVMLGLAYKRNYSQTKWWYTQQGGDGYNYEIKRTYQRLVFNVGVTF
jgi:hypothetical protein